MCSSPFVNDTQTTDPLQERSPLSGVRLWRGCHWLPLARTSHTDLTLSSVNNTGAQQQNAETLEPRTLPRMLALTFLPIYRP